MIRRFGSPLHALTSQNGSAKITFNLFIHKIFSVRWQGGARRFVEVPSRCFLTGSGIPLILLTVNDAASARPLVQSA